MLRPWWKSKWAIASNIALTYAGVAYYVNSLVQDEIGKRTTVQQGQEGSSVVNEKSVIKADIRVDEREPERPEEKPVSDNRPIFNRIAQTYDSALKWDERVMGMTIIRRFLLNHAKVKTR